MPWALSAGRDAEEGERVRQLADIEGLDFGKSCDAGLLCRDVQNDGRGCLRLHDDRYFS